MAMNQEAAINGILQRLDEARQLHPKWPADRIHQAAIMAEEAGESIQAAIDYTYRERSVGDFHWEVMQTAAMCLRILTEA